MKDIVFRCRSISEAGEYHHILVPVSGHVTCTCRGESWCSHIEATLVSGERAMVPPEDRLEADQAQVLAKGRIAPPEGWKSNWREHRRWRGLPVRESRAMGILRQGRPVVSIHGRGTKRATAARIARENGWEVVAYPTKGVIVHVSDRDGEDQRRRHAEDLGIIVLGHQQWPAIAPMGHTLRQRMRDLLSGGTPS